MEDTEAAQSQPKRVRGIPWGPFVIRFPGVHMRVEWSELVQGLVVALSTSLALVPLFMSAFGLSFEQAVTMSVFHGTLIAMSVWLFGEPYAPGWVTPALPIVLIFVIQGYDTPVERFHMMTALSLNFAFLLFFLGITGLGRKIINHVPNAFKAGIILGAAIAAFKRVFMDDFEKLAEIPWSGGLAIATCIIISFSIPFSKLKDKSKILGMIAGLGLLPGFIVAGIAGVITSELVFDIQWGIQMLPVGEMLEKVSPFYIGWPTSVHFVDAIPMALITYILLFGDLLTGEAIIKEAQPSRPDDIVDINIDRSHLSIGIRNVLMGLFAPFFPTQGALWTGVQVVVVEKWKGGKDKMESFMGGINAYYLFGVPMFVMVLPLLSLLKPFMFIALVLTLVLTGFACTYVAIAMVKERIERGVMLATAYCLAFFDPLMGLVVGLVGSLVLLGTDAFKGESKT